ncbi:MAG: cupredoxin domain-containing protein [Ignavibacteriaceae bacterium]|jgi:plastocyanin
MKRLFGITLITALFSLLLISCSSEKGHIIEITADGYSPSSLIVHKGDEVTWINKDNKPHTVSAGTSELWQFDSGEIKPGEEFKLEFTEPTVGSYIYYSKVQGDDMKGTIVVQPEASP